MNKKQRSILLRFLVFVVAITNVAPILPARGGRGGGGGGRSFGGGGGRGFSGRSGGMHGGSAQRTGGQRNYNHSVNRTTNVNVHNGYNGAWVAPAVVTTAAVGATVAAGAAASSARNSSQQSADAANRAAQSANTQNRMATGQYNRGRYQQTGTRQNNMSRPRQPQQRPSAPANEAMAQSQTRSARQINSKNPQRVNSIVSQQQRSQLRPRGGNTSRNSLPRRFSVGRRNAWGFWHNGRYFATYFWGGVPYYWAGGFWSPWPEFWALYPWWWSFYYTQNQSGLSYYECDSQYDCPRGDCPRSCLRYY